MYDDDGQLTEFAIQCHHYFNELKRAAEQKAFHARLEQCRLQHEQQQESVKRVNQSVKKSANQSRAQFIGSLRFELNQGVSDGSLGFSFNANSNQMDSSLSQETWRTSRW
ncbi:hypothetical protein IC830_08080 [Vibrio parahaemolyticus]|nr:hypothetical protein IC830_08080 [Vibrio parahaemolyticus]